MISAIFCGNKFCLCRKLLHILPVYQTVVMLSLSYFASFYKLQIIEGYANFDLSGDTAMTSSSSGEEPVLMPTCKLVWVCYFD